MKTIKIGELSVHFTAMIKDEKPPCIVHWDFGDKTSGSGIKTIHTYDRGGDYLVSVTVSDVTGASTSSKAIVSVTGKE